MTSLLKFSSKAKPIIQDGGEPARGGAARVLAGQVRRHSHLVPEKVARDRIDIGRMVQDGSGVWPNPSGGGALHNFVRVATKMAGSYLLRAF